MAKDSTEDEEAPAKGKGKAKKGKGNLVPAVVVAVAVLGGAYMLKGGSSKATAASAATTHGGTTTTTDPMLAPVNPKLLAQVATLQDITLNLSDGHFLKLGIALQLGKKATVTDYTTGGAAAPGALDLAINVVGNNSYAQLVQPTIREKVKAELSKKVVAAYNGQVLGVFFTDFVMQ